MAKFCAAIRVAREQKAISLATRAEATYAEYRRPKSERVRRARVPTTTLLTFITLPFAQRTTRRTKPEGSDSIRFSEELLDKREELLQVARQFQLEGLIAKRPDSV